jgi:hypothetical protein
VGAHPDSAAFPPRIPDPGSARWHRYDRHYSRVRHRGNNVKILFARAPVTTSRQGGMNFRRQPSGIEGPWVAKALPGQ